MLYSFSGDTMLGDLNAWTLKSIPSKKVYSVVHQVCTPYYFLPSKLGLFGVCYYTTLIEQK
jgi:hypothetical protein